MQQDYDIAILEKKVGEIFKMGSFIKTKWCVVTGPPSSGKTSVLSKLRQLGYYINSDISRQHIAAEIKKGRSKTEVRQDENELQRLLLLKMIANALSLPRNKRIFHDYALPDNIAFQKLAKIKPTRELLKSAELFRYDKVFVFDPLPMIADEVRTEDERSQEKLHKLIKETYTRLGYNIIQVPAIAVEQRTELILKNL